MKMTKKTVLAFLLIAVLAMLCGCNKTTSVESWAYNFDKSAEILKLNSDGTASYVLKVYENGVQVKKTVEYKSYKKDDSFITLTDKDGGELKLRYVKTDDGINLYEKTEYEQILKKEGNAVAGVWVDKNNSDYFYEFTEDGAFNEDGYFTGKKVPRKVEVVSRRGPLKAGGGSPWSPALSPRLMSTSATGAPVGSLRAGAPAYSQRPDNWLLKTC